MGRGAKHTLYGFLFLLLLGIIAGAVYLFFFKVSPSCEDNILNQDEESVDCGGVCIACEIKHFRLIKSEVGVVPIGKTKLTLVATIANANSNYGVTGVRYSLDIKNLVGESLDVIRDEIIIPPATTKYIVETGLPFNSSDVSRVEFEVEEKFNIVLGETFVQHNISIKQGKPTLSENIMRVDGIVTNNTGNNINVLKLNGFIRDSDGQLVSVAATIIDKLPAFKGKGFTIFASIPSNVSLDSLETEILWEVVS